MRAAGVCHLRGHLYFGGRKRPTGPCRKWWNATGSVNTLRRVRNLSQKVMAIACPLIGEQRTCRMITAA